MSQLVRLYRPDASRVVVLSRHAARNRDLSRKAKGLLYELCSLPVDGWELRHGWLCDLSMDGKHRLQSAVNELKEHGYLAISRQRNDGGTFGDALWLVTDDPERRPLPDPDNREQVETRITSGRSPDPDYPYPDEPDAGEPDTDEPTHSKTDSSEREVSTTDSRRAEGDSPLRELADTDPDENGRLTRALTAAWVSLQPERPSEPEIRKQGAVAKRLAEKMEPRRLALALYGMDRLYPHSEGEPWDLFDFERKLSKAANKGVEAMRDGGRDVDRQEAQRRRDLADEIERRRSDG